MGCHTWVGWKIDRTFEEGLSLAYIDIASKIIDNNFYLELIDFVIKYNLKNVNQ